jgi:hypothetical protein
MYFGSQSLSNSNNGIHGEHFIITRMINLDHQYLGVNIEQYQLTTVLSIEHYVKNNLIQTVTDLLAEDGGN